MTNLWKLNIPQNIIFVQETVFFSATWPKSVKDLAFDFCQYSPIYVQIGKSNLTINKNIDQEIICLFSRDKLQQLLDILDTLKISDKVLIFSEQKHRCEQLSINMADRGYYTIALHGDKTQPQRDEIMKVFRSGQTRLLCATDLASRGLDVTDITVVINYDFPKYFDDYIHRIGRTGRGEKKGKAFSFLTYDRDEPQMARELLKLAQVANLKYDESALQNFAIGIFPQMSNDFELDRFQQQQSRNNIERGNKGFSKNSQEQYHIDRQKSRHPQDNRLTESNYSKFSGLQNQKEDVSYGDFNYKLRYNEKYLDQSQQQSRDQYQSRNQWKEHGNQKDYQFENEEHRSQNYYQRVDKKQFYGKQERIDNRQMRQEEQSFDQDNKFGNDHRFYENDKQQRQFRQQGQNWSQRCDKQQRQIGQDRQVYGQEKSFAQNRQDRQQWQQYQENQDGNFRQERYERYERSERQNKKQQYDTRAYQKEEEDQRFLNDRQEKPYRQQDRLDPSNRENRRVNFPDDRYENSQQQYQSRIKQENNQDRWEHQKNQKQQEYWNNNQRQHPQQQRFNGSQNNPSSFDNQRDDFKNSRQEECKRQYTNKADDGNVQVWKNKQQENNDLIKNENGQQKVRFEFGNDRQHLFNNNGFGFHAEDNQRNQQFNRPYFKERQEDGRSQLFKNNDSINYHNSNQGRNYQEQNEKRRFENFRDTKQFNNQKFDKYSNSRQQNDNQNRLSRNQIEQNGNDDNKFKSHRSTQSLERNEQIRFYNSKQITRNVVKTDDQLNAGQQQIKEQNNTWRNKNNEPQNNQQVIIESQQIEKQNQNSDENQKKSSKIIEKQKVMEEINEIQEYNFNYDPNKSSSDEGEIEDNNNFEGYDNIEEEDYSIDHLSKNTQNHNIDLLSIQKTNVQIPTTIIQEQQVVMNEQYQIVEEDTKQIKLNINEREEDKVEEDSDNEYDFTRFGRTLEQENQTKVEVTQQQQDNNNRVIKQGKEVDPQ